MTKHQRAKKKKKENISKDAPPKSSFNWFPGHMTKAMRKIKDYLQHVDIVLEIRDARSPLITGNYSVKELLGTKAHLIIMNKTNLAHPEMIKEWDQWFSKQPEPYIFINGLDKTSLKKVIVKAKEVVLDNISKSNPDYIPSRTLKMMVIGLPNTGKSTIINRLANRDASKVADKPGQTQQQIWVNISKDMMILDTPGVMPPSIETDEHVLWLSALHAIPERIIDIQNTACYMVEHILKTNPSVFPEHYKFVEEEKTLINTLDLIAKSRGCLRQNSEFDYERVYKIIINDFRAGLLGPISLGAPPSVDKL